MMQSRQTYLARCQIPATPVPRWMWRRPLMCCGSDFCAMLLYSLIHLTGIRAANPSYEQLDRDAVTLEDIKNFRQAGSRCPGIRNMVGLPGSKPRPVR
jgi:transketolase